MLFNTNVNAVLETLGHVESNKTELYRTQKIRSIVFQMVPYDSRKINLSNWYQVPFMPGRVNSSPSVYLAPLYKVVVFSKGHKIWKKILLVLTFTQQHQKQVGGFQILWLSHNIKTYWKWKAQKCSPFLCYIKLLGCNLLFLWFLPPHETFQTG